MQKIFCLLLLLTGTASAQKVVIDPNATSRNITSFHSIRVSSGIDVFLSNGQEAVAVSASETKYRDRIKTQVENGVLKIWYDTDEKNIFAPNKRLKAYVAFKTLQSVSASGGCDIVVDGTIRAAKLSLNISGGSDFDGRVEVKNLGVDQSGGSDIKIYGSAQHVAIGASGGSDFNGYNLSVETCTAQASGGSDVEISVNKELSAQASGGSDISYKGNAALKEKKTSGASSVSRKS